jgi:hypothetical protein
MKKSRALSRQQLADLKLRALGRAVADGSGVSDPRSQSVMDLFRDMAASKDRRAKALAKALSAFSIPQVLALVDRIAPKKRGGQKRPNIRDAELVIQILERVANDEVLEHVVRELAERADGAGTVESKAQRLKLEFRKIWKSNSVISTKK